MSGYCATGMTNNSESAPAMVVTIAMTIAKRGRSTKIAETRYFPAGSASRALRERRRRAARPAIRRR